MKELILTIQDKLGEDLLRYIYSFGSVDVCVGKRRVNAEIETLIEKTIQIYYRDYAQELWIPKKKRKWFFLVLKSCPCCKKHSLRRPNRVDDPDIEYLHHAGRIIDCRCYCRMILRDLVRR